MAAVNQNDHNDEAAHNIVSQQSDFDGRYRLLVESIKDYAIYMLTPEGIVDSWNAGAEHFKGYRAEEIIGQSFTRFYTPEDQVDGLPARALRIAATEGKFEGEGWRMRKDGTRFWAHVVIDPVYDDDGSLIGFAKVTRDVSEKKVAQQALVESERRFRYLVKGVTDYAIYMLSPSGEITNWNAGAQRIKGYTADEIIGRNFAQFYTDEDRAVHKPQRALETARREGKFEAEGWRVRKDGTRFWAHIVIDPVYDDEGAHIGFAKITRDITEKRRTGEMLEEARAALAQSQKMEAIGKLTGGIAHDFNNLLQGIMGNLELMRLHIDNKRYTELEHHLESAISGIRRSAVLTHRLLAFARRQTLIPKPVNVSSLVQSMMDLTTRTVGPDIEIETQLLESPWQTLCDQHQLESALLNLIINARDAMPHGGKIIIRTANLSAAEIVRLPEFQAPPGDYVLLSVKDNGSGMTPDILTQVFEPFFTTKALGEGTGLGLSMVHGFVKQSEGHISIDSRLDKGTTVYLYFPRYEGELQPASTADSETPAMVQPSKRTTVLLVDDEHAVRSMLAEMLQQFGYSVLTAADGHEGLRMLQPASHIDLLITDIGLPGGMNGRQLADAARQVNPELKILFITGYAEQFLMRKEIIPTGMRVLAKPFTMESIMSTVQSMVEETVGEVTP